MVTIFISYLILLVLITTISIVYQKVHYDRNVTASIPPTKLMLWMIVFCSIPYVNYFVLTIVTLFWIFTIVLRTDKQQIQKTYDLNCVYIKYCWEKTY
jgi:O-antigen/teichoic acid export membrane protein